MQNSEQPRQLTRNILTKTCHKIVNTQSQITDPFSLSELWLFHNQYFWKHKNKKTCGLISSRALLSHDVHQRFRKPHHLSLLNTLQARQFTRHHPSRPTSPHSLQRLMTKRSPWEYGCCGCRCRRCTRHHLVCQRLHLVSWCIATRKCNSSKCLKKLEHQTCTK